MKSLVLQTDAPRTVELTWKHVYWTTQGSLGPEVHSKLVLIASQRTLADMLVEVDDGANIEDTRAAIQAAAAADDWATADEIARRYSLVVCLRCADDVSTRPTWRLHHLLRHVQETIDERTPGWGEVCGPCAVIVLDLKAKAKKK